MELVNLKIYNTQAEAEIFRIYLANAGVESFIFNTASSTIYPVFNQTIGGFQLKVCKEEFEKSKKLMKDFYHQGMEGES